MRNETTTRVINLAPNKRRVEVRRANDYDDSIDVTIRIESWVTRVLRSGETEDGWHNDGEVTITGPHTRFGKVTENSEVNWSAHGSQPVVKAEEYIALLNRAVMIAKELEAAPKLEIKAGDTVRVIHPGPNGMGTEFVVKEMVYSPPSEDDIDNGSFYATGDPASAGVWINFLEKVTS